METKIIVANLADPSWGWGKFLVGRFDSEWDQRVEELALEPVLEHQGWRRGDLLVLDLNPSGAGAIFRPGRPEMIEADIFKKGLFGIV